MLTVGSRLEEIPSREARCVRGAFPNPDPSFLTGAITPYRNQPLAKSCKNLTCDKKFSSQTPVNQPSLNENHPAAAETPSQPQSIVAATTTPQP